MALAGGVTLHLDPEHYIAMAKLGMLAPDGRCKSFDARANGFVPGEGCGIVVLKRLADALADGDRVRAVIRGSAVNQDGRTNVLTAPNGLAQQAVLKAALDNAQVAGANVTYLETHGTGTALGDPIEFEAIASVAGSAQPTPCALGAVKTNIGHLEAAAGVAGLIKAALALEHEEIPPNLHYQRINPHISLDGTRFFVPVSPTPWPRSAAIRFAGVSSFGFGGTNAHLVLEEAPRLPRRDVEPPQESGFLLPISARTTEALTEMARQYRTFLAAEAQSGSLYAICHTAARRRSHYEERLAITAKSREDFVRLFDEFLAGHSRAGIAAGRPAAGTPALAFVFSGQGSQWPGMGAALIQHDPAFAAALSECDTLIRRHGGWSVIEQLSATGEVSKLNDTEYAQPAIFALEVALARLWESWGIKPSVVIGHSAG
ncbi:MAG: acyltransferase domain-containing protein, partial [Bryobacteraceae bacterium]